MAQHSADTIREIIKPCGLSPQKSKAIRRLSEILLENSGEVPAEFEALERLPGVGHKTASVVMAQSFGYRAFRRHAYHRLAQRWGLTRGRNVNETERDLKKAFARERWNDLHLQIIFYGREYCTAKAVTVVCARSALHASPKESTPK